MGKENTNPPEQNSDEIIRRYQEELGRKSDFERLDTEVTEYQAQHPEEYRDTDEQKEESDPDN